MSKQAYILHGKGELVPELDFSVGQLLLRQLTIHDTRVAQIDAHTGKEQTFKYILDTSRKLAIYLQKEGLKVNDAVAVCSENNLEFCIPVCATFYLGAIVCPLNPLYSTGELKHALTITKPKYIFISMIALNNIISILKELHWSPRILLLNDYDNIDKSWMSICEAVSSVSDDNINKFQAVPVDVNNHVTAILCSSGTTGLPKGVMWTDKNITTIIRMYVSNQLVANAKIIPLGKFETDETLGPNCEGELCFKGDLIMKGYYNDKKSTSMTIDKDGWLHTGDVGYYDEEGYFYIVDRVKELIKYKGYQVPPAELEAILLTYSGIKDAAVIGIPNEKTGELPIAFVVKQKGFDIREEDIIQYVNERVSNPKRLRGGIKFVDSIPKTPSGKILRRVLRDMILKSKI
ncbi:hypothetical protein ACFW04_000689 [Cataglyphis niger]